MIQLELERSFYSRVKGVLEKYDFEVGVIKDGPHKLPQGGTTTYAGGPARKTSSKPSGMTISEVSSDLRKNTGINIFLQPFKSRKNKDIVNFVKDYFELCMGRTQKRRVENLLQAVVRNPMLRGDYGRNTSKTAKIKGFNRYLIDTAQLFKNITAKVRVRRVSS